MTTITGARAGSRTRPPVAPSRSRVRLPELVLGVLLVAGGALAAVVWHSSTTATSQVTVLARALERGEMVTASDLRSASARLSGVAITPWAEAGSLVGRVASTDLAAGTPVSRSLLVTEPLLASAEGLVALALGAGDAPPLEVGDLVDVVPAEAEGGVDPAAISAPLATAATVWRVEPAGDRESRVVVTLRLPVEAARTVASTSGARLVRIGG
jgi:hypothetical protein